MSKIDQVKIPISDWTPTVKLVRADGLTKQGTKFGFVEWNGPELGSSFKQLHDTAQAGFSCIIDPQRMSYTWLTSAITEVVSDEETDTQRCITFHTQNSDYTLYIEKQ